MKHTKALLSVLLAVSATAAYADDHAKTTMEAVDATGAKVTTETSTDKSTGMITGATTAKTHEEAVRDPKGLMNKSKGTYDTKSVVKKNGDTSQTVTSVDAAGTKHEVTHSKETSKDIIGSGSTTTAKTEESIDRQGLGNKQTAEVEKRVKTGSDGSKTETTTKKLNGDTVEETSKEVH